MKTPEDYVCNECGASEWKGKQLVLQFHHRDGNQKNAELSNLVLLCPNCHTATDSWGGNKQTESKTSDSPPLATTKGGNPNKGKGSFLYFLL